MMKKIFLICMFTVSFADAQQDTLQQPVPVVPVPLWKHSVVGAITATQVAFYDWTQGGENAFSYTVSLDAKSVRTKAKTEWSSSAKLAFGQTRLGNQGTRKTDDKIDLESVLTYKIGAHINPYVAATFKTQFATGYKYDDPLVGKVPVSAFFDPAYLTQSLGFGYQPIPQIKVRLGAALREILTNKYTLYSDDPSTLTAIERTLLEGGLESVIDIEWKIEENVLFTSKFELFSAFKTIDQVVVRNDNVVAAKIGKLITVILNMQLLNERKITPRTQIKETVGLGISYTFL